MAFRRVVAESAELTDLAGMKHALVVAVVLTDDATVAMGRPRLVGYDE
jgi:hypothetical protein